jgi:hypothetical protein
MSYLCKSEGKAAKIFKTREKKYNFEYLDCSIVGTRENDVPHDQQTFHTFAVSLECVGALEARYAPYLLKKRLGKSFLCSTHTLIVLSKEAEMR